MVNGKETKVGFGGPPTEFATTVIQRPSGERVLRTEFARGGVRRITTRGISGVRRPGEPAEPVRVARTASIPEQIRARALGVAPQLAAVVRPAIRGKAERKEARLRRLVAEQGRSEAKFQELRNQASELEGQLAGVPRKVDARTGAVTYLINPQDPGEVRAFNQLAATFQQMNVQGRRAEKFNVQAVQASETLRREEVQAKTFGAREVKKARELIAPVPVEIGLTVAEARARFRGKATDQLTRLQARTESLEVQATRLERKKEELELRSSAARQLTPEQRAELERDIARFNQESAKLTVAQQKQAQAVQAFNIGQQITGFVERGKAERERFSLEGLPERIVGRAGETGAFVGAIGVSIAGPVGFVKGFAVGAVAGTFGEVTRTGAFQAISVAEEAKLIARGKPIFRFDPGQLKIPGGGITRGRTLKFDVDIGLTKPQAAELAGISVELATIPLALKGAGRLTQRGKIFAERVRAGVGELKFEQVRPGVFALAPKPKRFILSVKEAIRGRGIQTRQFLAVQPKLLPEPKLVVGPRPPRPEFRTLKTALEREFKPFVKPKQLITKSEFNKLMKEIRTRELLLKPTPARKLAVIPPKQFRAKELIGIERELEKLRIRRLFGEEFVKPAKPTKFKLPTKAFTKREVRVFEKLRKEPKVSFAPFEREIPKPKITLTLAKERKLLEDLTKPKPAKKIAPDLFKVVETRTGLALQRVPGIQPKLDPLQKTLVKSARKIAEEELSRAKRIRFLRKQTEDRIRLQAVRVPTRILPTEPLSKSVSKAVSLESIPKIFKRIAPKKGRLFFFEETFFTPPEEAIPGVARAPAQFKAEFPAVVSAAFKPREAIGFKPITGVGLRSREIPVAGILPRITQAPATVIKPISALRIESLVSSASRTAIASAERAGATAAGVQAMAGISAGTIAGTQAQTATITSTSLRELTRGAVRTRTRLRTISKFPTRFRTTRFFPKLKPPKPIFRILPPRLEEEVETVKKKRLFEAFEVLVKRRGKFRRISTEPLTKLSAFRLGAKLVEETPAATFKLVETISAKKPRKLGLPPVPRGLVRFPVKRGRPMPGLTFIERTKFRISKPKELEGITFKGLAAIKRKRRGGLF